MRCKLSSRKALALCLIGGMGVGGARAGAGGALAILGFGGKNNKAVVTRRQNNKPNTNPYLNAAIQVVEAQYGTCLEKAVAGGVFAPTAQSCLQELTDNQNQFMKLQIESEAKQLALALKQRSIKNEAQLMTTKANINKEIAILTGKGRLANAKQISKLKNRARTVENQLNALGGALTKGVATYASKAGGEIAGGAVGAFSAGALGAFMNQTGLNKMAMALVLTAAVCAASLAMVATAGTTVASIFRVILRSIYKLIKAGTMPPIMIIKKLLGTTRTYVTRSTQNRSQRSIQRNVSTVVNSERTITQVRANNNNNSASSRRT